MPLIRQRLAVVLRLIFSIFLTRRMEPRHAASVSLPPSNPVRPRKNKTLKLFNILIYYILHDRIMSTYTINKNQKIEEKNKTEAPEDRIINFKF